MDDYGWFNGLLMIIHEESPTRMESSWMINIINEWFTQESYGIHIADSMVSFKWPVLLRGLDRGHTYSWKTDPCAPTVATWKCYSAVSTGGLFVYAAVETCWDDTTHKSVIIPTLMRSRRRTSWQGCWFSWSCLDSCPILAGQLGQCSKLSSLG